MEKEAKKELEDDLGKAKAILVVKDSEGGKMLIDGLRSDIDGIINRLINSYKESTHIQLISEIASLEAKRNLLNDIESSEYKVEILKNELK